MLGLLAACAPALPPPMTLPPADGRAEEVQLGVYRYVVGRQGLEQALGGVILRVTRATAPEMDYSEGLTAKRVAEAYCAKYNRKLDPVAFGKFSAPAAWIFDGGCV